MLKSLPSCLEPPADGSRWAPPVDVYDVVVRLESAGLTEKAAKLKYGDGAWQLANAWLPAAQAIPAVRDSKRKDFVVLDYLRGLTFALPLILCCLAMSYFDFSLWGGDVSAVMAGAVGLGTISSFIVTGGIVQAMARRGLFFLSVEDGAASEAACWRWVRSGAAYLALSGALLAAFARFYSWLPSPFDLAAVAFHVTLGMLWLATGILHMLERNVWSAAATVAGISVVAVLHLAFGVTLVVAQIIGILAATGVAFAACYLLLRAKGRANGGRTRRQTICRDLCHTWPYFVYGALYYVLVFADRLLAWTVPDIGAASVVQFRGYYETALDLALIAFVLQVGIIRVCAGRFFHSLAAVQSQLHVRLRADFIRRMAARYWRTSAGLLLFVSAVSSAVCTTVVSTGLIADRQIYSTMCWAAAGNALLVIALWNTSLLFRLSRPVDVLAVLGPAVAADITIGYLVTRLGSYEQAVFGFAAGALVYAVLATRTVVARLRSLDYFYFASAL